MLDAARERGPAPLLPPPRVGRPRPVVEMEGARADHARLQQLPRPDRRRARHRRRRATRSTRYGTGLTGSRLLNGTLDLHLELEAELADWMGTEDALVFTTGHQANVGALGTLLGPGDTVIADSRRPRLDPRRLPALAAPSCAPSATTGSTSSSRCSSARRATAAACSWSSTASSRWRATSPTLPRDRRRSCARYGARLMVDEAHGVGVLGARGARRRRAARRRGPGRPADGHVLEVARLLRRLHRRPGRGDRLPADLSRAPFLFTASAVPAAVGAALAAVRICRSDEGPAAASPRVLDNARYLHARAARARLPRRRPARCRTAGRGHADRAGARRRRLEGRAALEGALRRRRLRQRGPAPGRAAGRRAAAHERDGDPRPRHAGPRAVGLRRRSSAPSRPSTGRFRGPTRSPPPSRPSSPVPALARGRGFTTFLRSER